MNPDSFSNNAQIPSVEPHTQKGSSRLESTAFYIFLATIVLAPLAFLPTTYIVIDIVKTVIIAVGTLLSAVLYGILAYKKRSLVLPSRGVFWTGILVAISLLISSFVSTHLGKSFFGQGFEINTASFMLVLFVAGVVAFTIIQYRSQRTLAIYVSMTVPFIILALLHILRFIFGQSFLSLGILSNMTNTIVGTWYDLASYALVIVFITLSALIFLPLTRRVKGIYWLILLVSLILAFLINSAHVWFASAVTLLGLTIYLTNTRPRPVGGAIVSYLKRLAWLPFVFFVIAALLSWKGVYIAGPTITKIDAVYNTLTLPWQMTLDVDAGAIKDNPVFGVGPNHFGQAYLTYKPISVNSTYAWNAEFNYGFSLLSTFIATQGIVGIIVWILFFILVCVAAIRTLRNLPSDPHSRFTAVSSLSVAFFLLIMMAISVPSHSLLLYACISIGIGLSVGATSGALKAYMIAPRMGTKSRGIFGVVILLLVIIGLVWSVVYIKDTVAFAYFGSGVKALTVKNDPAAADALFSKAQSLNTLDIYFQARAEAGILKANQLIATVNQNTPASTSQAVLDQVVATANTAIKYAQSAIAYDPTNYYNYVSEARISELALSVRMDKAYENAVKLYTKAISINPLNPTLYLNLARLQASQNKLDESLQTLGASLQVKNNYLDAIFLLSQVEAAKGNLKDAIIAAQVATQINPQNAILFFQLGLLQYNNRDYQAAAQAFESALKIQPDYANVQYFLGLSYIRLNKISDAMNQFTLLSKTNPDNQEVAFILTNLQSGKSPFADAKPPITPTPEKRSSLPIKESRK